VLGEEKGQTSERAEEIGGEGTEEERAGEGEGGGCRGGRGRLGVDSGLEEE